MLVALSWKAAWPVGKLWNIHWQEPTHRLSFTSLIYGWWALLPIPLLLPISKTGRKARFSLSVSEKTWPSAVGFHFSQMTT